MDDLGYAGERIRGRRVELDATQAEASRQAGVSDTVWNEVERGRRSVSERTAAKIMRWCGWTTDSYKLLLARKAPKPAAPAPTPTAEDPVAALSAWVQELDQRIGRLEGKPPATALQEATRRAHAVFGDPATSPGTRRPR